MRVGNYVCEVAMTTSEVPQFVGTWASAFSTLVLRL